MKSLPIYFGRYSLAFLNSFLNILNKYILVLNKCNFKYVICLFINLFLQYFGARGQMRWGPRAEVPRVDEQLHPNLITIN